MALHPCFQPASLNSPPRSPTTSLSLAGNWGRFTWLRHSIPETAALTVATSVCRNFVCPNNGLAASAWGPVFVVVLFLFLRAHSCWCIRTPYESLHLELNQGEQSSAAPETGTNCISIVPGFSVGRATKLWCFLLCLFCCCHFYFVDFPFLFFSLGYFYFPFYLCSLCVWFPPSLFISLGYVTVVNGTPSLAQHYGLCAFVFQVAVSAVSACHASGAHTQRFPAEPRCRRFIWSTLTCRRVY